MFDRLKAAVGAIAGRTQNGITLVSSWLANALWLMEAKFIPLAKQGFGQNAVVYACLRLLSQSVPEASLKVYLRKGDDLEEVPENHPLAMLIRDPNELMTEYEMLELMVLHLGICGRTTWWKERDKAGNVIALYPLRPDRVGPLYSDTDKPGQKVLAGWSYQIPGRNEVIGLPRADVLMVNFPNPFEESGGMVEGLGPLQVLAAEVSADNEATSFVGALLKNSATPTTVLKTKAPIRDQKQADIIKAKFRSEFGGSRRGTPALLDAETEITSLGFNLQELEFPDLRDVAESRIAADFGVPPILAGLNVGLKRGTYANYAEARRYFAETTLANYWRRISDVWNRDIVQEFDANLIAKFDTSEVKALASQRLEELQPLKEGVSGGVNTPNEYRQRLGLDLLPPEVGDVLYIPSGVTVVAASEEARLILDERKQEAIVQAQQNLIAQQAEKPEEGDEPDDDPPTKALKVATDDDERRTAAEKRLEKRLNGAFQTHLDEVLEAIKRGVDPDLTNLNADLLAILEAELVEIAAGQAERDSTFIGVGFDPALINIAALEWAQKYAGAELDIIDSTTREFVKKAIATFIGSPGTTNEQLIELLKAGGFSERRARVIAITEVTGAYAAGSHIAQQQLKEAGIPMVKIFRTSADDRVCPVCGPSNGKPESEWDGAGPPPRHSLCRCWLTLRSEKG